MIFELSEKSRTFRERVEAFMDELVYPNETKYHEQLGASGNRWSVPRVMEELKEEAKARGLWNLFLPDSDLGAGLTTRCAMCTQRWRRALRRTDLSLDPSPTRRGVGGEVRRTPRCP